MLLIKTTMFFCILPTALFAACPPGYIEINTDKVIVSETSCQSGTIAIDNSRILPANENACDARGCYAKTCAHNN
jgi:hypothetical protein